MTLFSSFGNQIWFKDNHMNVKFARVTSVLIDFIVSTYTGNEYPYLGNINLHVVVMIILMTLILKLVEFELPNTL
jgi:hypothetical protein